MHPLPPDFDASTLIGRRVERVSYTANTIDLVFDGQISIQVVGQLEYRRGGKPLVLDACESDEAAKAALSDLTGAEIVGASSVRKPAQIDLAFSNSDDVRLFDDSDQYESFQIETESRLIVV